MSEIYLIFYDIVVLPDSYAENLSESDTILNGIIGLDIQEFVFEFMLPEDKLETITGDIYGVKSKESFLMCLKFNNNSCFVIDNEGTIPDKRGSTTYNK